MSRPATIGTAGHVDHGKTTLVTALTGRDTDRLAEEKRRGISIELGFVELDLGNRRLSLIDVPGHERFVRTMIAGASGVDAYLLLVAADDGVMPQTIEHLAVLHALGVDTGVIALSKCDLATARQRESAKHEVAMLTPGTPIVEVSAQCRTGLVQLRNQLRRASDDLRPRPDNGGAPILHIDRVFTVAGHGTVVTGTLSCGRLERGQSVTVVPSDARARVRSLHVHDRPVEAADACQRVALNLAGVRRGDVARGDVVTVSSGMVEETFRLDVELTAGAEQIAAQRRVQAYLGTRGAPARVADLGNESVQLRLEQPLLARPGDRVVVRSIAPPDTLGGGIVVHASPPRHGPGWVPSGNDTGDAPSAPPLKTASSELDSLARRILIEMRDDGPRPRSPAVLAGAVDATPKEVERALASLVAWGEATRVRRDVVYPAAEYHRLREEILGLARRDGSTSVAEVRDELGVSRKYAGALLEFLDAERDLRRVGDRHFPRKARHA